MYLKYFPTLIQSISTEPEIQCQLMGHTLQSTRHQQSPNQQGKLVNMNNDISAQMSVSVVEHAMIRKLVQPVLISKSSDYAPRLYQYSCYHTITPWGAVGDMVFSSGPQQERREIVVPNPLQCVYLSLDSQSIKRHRAYVGYQKGRTLMLGWRGTNLSVATPWNINPISTLWLYFTATWIIFICLNNGVLRRGITISSFLVNYQ